jgi:pyrroloquinoline quinone biosynthesis protein E
MVADDVRGTTAVLYPEGVLLLNETAHAVVGRCDGVRSLHAIATDLAATFDGVTVESVAEVVTDLLARRVLTLGGGPRPLPGLTPPQPRAIREPVPVGLLAELTYRCPLRCPYCSNPVNLDGYAGELTTSQWTRALDQARALGVLQVHLSGGEPLLRPDLVDLVAHARGLGQYTNLITSGIPLSEDRLAALVGAGLDHVQLSIQDATAPDGDAVAGIRAHDRKVEVAALIRGSGLAFTVNVVLHAGNVDRIEAIADYAEGLGAQRVELAHTQYYGWGLRNRAALMPTAEQVARADEAVERMRAKSTTELVYVPADYHGDRPKPCMQGWGAKQLVIAPNGDVLPCLAAASLPDLEIPNVRQGPLEDIWYTSAAFEAFRGTAWMKEPCRSCELRTVDFGGCRCQAYALVGDAAATDPVCGLSPHHDLVEALAKTPTRTVPMPRKRR